MATPLNRVPPGLLDFFGIKSGEWGPRELGQQLVPTLDLARWYLDPGAISVAISIAGAPFGATGLQGAAIFVTTPTDLTTGGLLVVPQTEIWMVLEANIRWTTSDAAGTVQIGLRSGLANQHFDVWPMLVQGFTTGAAVIRGGSACLDRPLLVLSGHEIQALIYGITGAVGSVLVTGALRLVRLRI